MRITIFLIALTVYCLSGCSKNNSSQSEQLPSGGDLPSVVLHKSPDRTPQETPPTENTLTVKEAYSAFTKAVLDGDGQEAAFYVTDSTIQMYDSCRKLALDSSNTDFANLTQIEVVMVFQLRYLLEKSKLEQMSGREVFEWGVSDGLVSKEEFESVEVHKVQYDGATAFATMLQHGKVDSGGLFTFRKEHGQWKFDMVKLLSIVENQLEKIRKRADKSKIELAVFLLEKQYGKLIPPRILDGPLN